MSLEIPVMHSNELNSRAPCQSLCERSGNRTTYTMPGEAASKWSKTRILTFEVSPSETVTDTRNTYSPGGHSRCLECTILVREKGR